MGYLQVNALSDCLLPTNINCICTFNISFWRDLIVRLTLLHITPEHYTIDPLVALDLKPDSSKNHPQINFSCLLARYYIWMSKRKETAPKVEGFLQYFKSIYQYRGQCRKRFPKKVGIFEHIIAVSLVFQSSVYLDPLYILPVFDFWYICSAITAF